MTIGPNAARDLQQNLIRDFIEWLGAGKGASVFETDGVRAAIVPSAARRSIVNSAIADSAASIASAYEDLEQAYRDAGVEAWTFWIHEDDQDVRALLEARGHVFDGDPVAMVLDLGGFDAASLGDLDWDAHATPEEVGRLNDLAYGYETETGMAAAITAAPVGPALRLYRARVDGEVACVLGTLDAGDDAGILFVATLKEMRGRRLASRLLSAALVEARKRGIRTSSLQASALGSPIYARLGYEACFRFNILERRFGAQADE